MINKAMLFEQIDSLVLFYPTEKIVFNNSQKTAWWPAFKNFEPEDIIQGIIACRRESRRFPSVGFLESCAIKAQESREKKEIQTQLESHKIEKNKGGIMSEACESDLNSEAGDAIKVIQFYLSTGMKKMAAKKMRELSKKHDGNKNGFIRMAFQFENLE